jgi:hypothetical protein
MILRKMGYVLPVTTLSHTSPDNGSRFVESRRSNFIGLGSKSVVLVNQESSVAEREEKGPED